MFTSLLELADAVRHRGRSRSWPPDKALGRRGEDIAHRFLERQGMIVVARNYRMESGGGEVDLVAWERESLVFVEVKTRQTEEYGAPDRAIGIEKHHALLRTGREYARHAEVPWERVRFDVVSVVLRVPPVVSHYRNVLAVKDNSALAPAAMR